MSLPFPPLYLALINCYSLPRVSQHSSTSTKILTKGHAHRYENPFITATSRSVIADIYSLTRQLCYVDVPKPLAMLYTLFRLTPPEDSAWFQGLRVWTEIGDICESESFGGCPI